MSDSGKRLRGSAQTGFSLVEVVMVLMVMGLLAWVVSSAYVDSGGRSRQQAQARGNSVKEAIRAFALNNARLPCPDLVGAGWEGAGNGCAAGVQMGWVPYLSLGLEQPAVRDRFAYGVYRNAGANADLTVSTDRSGDGNQNVRDLMVALQTAQAAQSPVVSSDNLHQTGDGGALGAIDCANNRVANPAFVLIAPIEDRDGNGNVFDGVHTGLPGAGRCVQSPATAASTAQDDVVIVEGLSSLMGWLSAHAS